MQASYSSQEKIGEVLVKNYMIGLVISAVCFIALTFINLCIYNNVMSLSVIIPLLLFHIVLFKYLIPIRRLVPYFLFVCIFVIFVLFTIPKLTMEQAKEKVAKEFQLVITEESTVPIAKNGWSPFLTDRAYFLRGNDAKGEEMSIMVSPNSGKAFKIKE